MKNKFYLVFVLVGVATVVSSVQAECMELKVCTTWDALIAAQAKYHACDPTTGRGLGQQKNAWPSTGQCYVHRYAVVGTDISYGVGTRPHYPTVKAHPGSMCIVCGSQAPNSTATVDNYKCVRKDDLSCTTDSFDGNEGGE